MPLRPGSRGMLLIFALVLIAACGGPPAGTERSSGQQAVTSTEALGDLGTVDPCTLTDRAKLASLGEVSDPGTVSLDYCLLHVRMSDGSLVQLATGEMAAVEPGEQGQDPVVRRGALRLLREAPLPGHCARQILFADGVAMRISADLLSGSPGIGLCGVAEAGAESAIAAIEHRDVGHRQYPAGSLAGTDPCDVLDTDVVRQVPGLEQAPARRSPTRHECRWGREEASSPRVRLTHTAGEPPKVLHGTAVQERIAGRDTVISVVGGDPRTPLCSAETAHLPFGDANSGQVEVAMLVVALPGTTGLQACEFARGLAERAWPNLPRG